MTAPAPKRPMRPIRSAGDQSGEVMTNNGTIRRYQEIRTPRTQPSIFECPHCFALVIAPAQHEWWHEVNGGTT